MKKLILSISLAISTIAMAQETKAKIFYLNKDNEEVSEKEDWEYKIQHMGSSNDEKAKIFRKNNQFIAELSMKIEGNIGYFTAKEYEKSHPNQTIVKLSITEQPKIISDETLCYTMDNKLVKNEPCTDDALSLNSFIGKRIQLVKYVASPKSTRYPDEMDYNIRKWVAENLDRGAIDIPVDGSKNYTLKVEIDENKVPKLIKIDDKNVEDHPNKEEQRELKRVISRIPKQYLMESTTISIPLQFKG